MTIISHDAKQHRLSTEVEGNCAYLDYTLADGVMTITHTKVPPAIGGRGIAAELMAAALETARSARWSVHPACSYAVAYMNRHAAADASQQHTDELLDEALDESFPASDSPAVGGVS